MILITSDFFKPRFEFTRIYPGCPFRVGDVLEASEFEGETYIRIDSNDRKILPFHFSYHFRKLRWWEHRTIEQLVSIKYMKVVSGAQYYVVGDIVEVIDVMFNNPTIVGGNNSILFNLKGHHFIASQLEPATKEEHDKFWNK